MHLAEKLSIAIRHNKHLEHSTWLWNKVRPLYDRVVSITGHRGLKRVINDTDSILVSPKCRGVIEEYEPDVWRSLMAEIRAGDWVVDIGTFIGLYTISLGKRVGPKGRVFAFEPDPRNFAMLEENVRLNGLDGRVELVCAAAGSSDGEVCFASEAIESHVVPGMIDAAADGKLRVKCVTLDSIFADNRLDVMKIDVEGYEERVLQGAKRLLSERNPSPRVLYIEVHPYAWPEIGTTSDSLLDLLKNYHYEVATLQGEPVRSISQYGEIIARKVGTAEWT